MLKKNVRERTHMSRLRLGPKEGEHIFETVGTRSDRVTATPEPMGFLQTTFLVPRIDDKQRADRRFAFDELALVIDQI